MESIAKLIPALVILNSAFLLNEKFEEFEKVLENKRKILKEVQNKIKKAKEKKKQANAFVSDLESTKKRFEFVSQEFESLQRKLPIEISSSKDIEIFKGITEELNIQDVEIKPSTEENVGLYFKKKYFLKARGTYLQFLIFMEKIEASERLLNILSIHLKKDEPSRGRFQLISAQIQLETYRYNIEPKKDLKKDKLKSKKKGAKA